MTGDARRDHEATSHHWGGTDQPIEDEYAAYRRAEAERKALERHECPKGYEGPCWGPTKADLDAIDQEEQQTWLLCATS